MDGIICIDKPKEFTSFDVIAKLRGMLRIKGIGHGGTLDPMATGVLPIFIGKATKVCDIIPNQDKKYLATVKLGLTTDTQDITGRILSQKESFVNKEQFQNVMNNFVGNINQIPPMYSAVKIGGKKLYQLAREGKEIKREPRPVQIYHIKLIQFNEKNQTAIIDVACSKGTYIRTLCSDIGEKLNVGACLQDLKRTQAGEFSIKDCLKLEQVQRLCDYGEIERELLPIEKVFDKLPKINLDEHKTKLFLNGVKLRLEQVNFEKLDLIHRIYDNKENFIATAIPVSDKQELKINKIFVRKELNMLDACD